MMRKAPYPYAEPFRHYRLRQRGRIWLALFLLLIAALSFAASYVFEMDAWSKLDADKILSVDQSLLLYDGSGSEVTALHLTEDRIWTKLGEIPKHTCDAFISAEDARFYDHFGVDVIRILGAAWADLKAGSYVQGASTISQQLIKLSHLSSEKKIERKLEEAVLAYQLERIYSKNEILEMYLNYVYFGGGYYGIEAAARGYFGVHASELTVAQSAMLAGILKAPSRFAPHINPEASLGRRNVVLGLMRDYGFIDDATYAASCAEEVRLAEHSEGEKRGYYIDLAMEEACERLNIDMDTLLSGGYRVETYLNAELQAACEAAFADEANFPEVADADGEQPEGAIVAVDVESGGVAALLGGRESEGALMYNRATRIRRQPGSVIKPILVYAPALENGFTTATMLLDEQMDFDGYSPGNASGTFCGWVTMREAVKRSLNVPAVSVFAQVGVETGKTFAKKLGVSFDARDKSLALSLGGFTYGVSPMQMAGAYAAFARGGVYVAPQLVKRITNAEGNVLYEHIAVRTRVMSAANAYVLTSMLEDVVEDGTGKRLGEAGIPLAGKTGTTGMPEGNRDAWMAAYNPAYAMAVWIGYDSAADGRALPEDAAGGTYPAEILRQVFSELYLEGDAPNFAMPEGVKEYRIDSRTLDSEHNAVLASAFTPEDASYSEVFVEGTEPAETTSYWQVPSPPAEVRVQRENMLVHVAFDAPSRWMIYRLYRENPNGKSILLEEFSNVEGTATYTDDGITKYGIYQYYVIPVHPQLMLNGQQAAGEASPRARAYLES